MIASPLIPAEAAVTRLGRAVFIDARAGADARASYLEGHVPGAAHADLETQLSQVGDPQKGGRHPLPPWSAWLAQVGRWGIRPSTPVLVYDANHGAMAAARLWWMLRAIGHEPLSVVDGGWDALRRAGIVVENQEALSEPAPPYPSARRRWPSIEIAEVDRLRGDPRWRLVDARAPERYDGEVEPIDPIAGHVPGAVNAYWKASVDARGTFIDRAELRRRFDNLLGDVSADRVVCYCGSGVTACHLLLALEASGLHGAGLYVGSWSEWCRTRAGAIASS